MNEYIKQMIEAGRSQEDILKAFTEIYAYEKEVYEDRLAKEAEARAKKEREDAEAAAREKAQRIRNQALDDYYVQGYIDDTKESELIESLAAANADLGIKMMLAMFDKSKLDRPSDQELEDTWYDMYKDCLKTQQELIEMLNMTGKDFSVVDALKLLFKDNKPSKKAAGAPLKDSAKKLEGLFDEAIADLFKALGDREPKQKATFVVDKDRNKKLGKTNRLDTSDSDYFKFLF